MPPVFDDSVPVPFPVAVAVTVNWLSVKAASTDESAVIENVQSPVPVQPTDPVPLFQPPNVEPVYAAPVRVMLVPLPIVHVATLPTQISAQSGVVTFPEPLPVLVTVRV